jgi:hypothetical protein
MELLSPLRELARRPLILALGVLGSLLLAFAASGYGPGPLASPERRSAIATAEIQIDTARPLAADLRASTATVADQAVMLGESLSADDKRAEIAAHAGVDPEGLAVLSTRTAIVGRASPLARSAVDAASAVQTPMRITVMTASDTPLITVTAFAPDRETAIKLAAATAPALQSVIDAAPPTVKKRLEVKPLAEPQAITVVNGGPRPLIAIAAAIFAFVGWCWAVLALGGLGRFWRWAADPFAARA